MINHNIAMIELVSDLADKFKYHLRTSIIELITKFDE